MRTRSVYDGALASGNSQMIHNLIDLGRLDRAAYDLRRFAGPLEAHGHGMAHMQHALLRAMELAPQHVGRASGPAGGADEAVSAVLEPVDREAGVYRVVVTIAEGFHLYAHDAAAEGVTPTVLAPGRVVSPPAVSREDAGLSRPVRVYEGVVVFQVTLDPKNLPQALTLTCQPCTDRACLAVRTVTLLLEHAA